MRFRRCRRFSVVQRRAGREPGNRAYRQVIVDDPHLHAILSVLCATLHCQILEYPRERRRDPDEREVPRPRTDARNTSSWTAVSRPAHC